MIEIALSKGKIALVSDEDADLVGKHTWWVFRSGRMRADNAYAFTTVSRKTVFMHRLILGAPLGTQVDHKNRDGLDNRRENLRLCTQALNNANTPTRSVTGYRGVYPNNRKFRAELTAFGQCHQLGTFGDPVEAAHAYDAAAIEKFGHFASLNFPVAS